MEAMEASVKCYPLNSCPTPEVLILEKKLRRKSFIDKVAGLLKNMLCSYFLKILTRGLGGLHFRIAFCSTPTFENQGFTLNYCTFIGRISYTINKIFSNAISLRSNGFCRILVSLYPETI